MPMKITRLHEQVQRFLENGRSVLVVAVAFRQEAVEQCGRQNEIAEPNRGAQHSGKRSDVHDTSGGACRLPFLSFLALEKAENWIFLLCKIKDILHHNIFAKRIGSRDEKVARDMEERSNDDDFVSYRKDARLCGRRDALGGNKSDPPESAIARHLALAALRDQSYMQETTGRIKRTRAVFSKQLESLGFSVVPAQTNFILCQPPAKAEGQSARELYEKLMEQGIYVRYDQLPRLADMLRITVGTEAEMEEVYAALSPMIE
jgi:hypothetical protein